MKPEVSEKLPQGLTKICYGKKFLPAVPVVLDEHSGFVIANKRLYTPCCSGKPLELSPAKPVQETVLA